MARQVPLYLIFQWHMHQPFYQDALSGEYLLPWTRLHATKDYTDMAWHLERFPAMKCAVNFVPSLLVQLKAYADFDTIPERHLQVTSKPVEDLTEEDRRFVLRWFFQINQDRTIRQSARYTDLLGKRGEDSTPESIQAAVESFTSRDYLDLQVWFLLAWTGQDLRRQPEVQALIEKDAGFRESEKLRLLEIHQEAIQKVLFRYDTLLHRGQIDITGTPYAHPILPLLIDTDIARLSRPNVTLPAHRFRHPKEAERQVKMAVHAFREVMGWNIHGMWPAEGAVSEAALDLLVQYGIQWITTDSNILARSLSEKAEPVSLTSQQQYAPYTFATQHGDLTLFFRDQRLSDALSFQYAGMEAADAVDDFLAQLHTIDQNLPDDGFPYLVVISMDGENAWEYFLENGKPFFDELYGRLVNSPRIRPVTFSEYLERTEVKNSLERVVPGSWIQADFHIWIGDALKNAAWDRLDAALRFLDQKRADGIPIPEEAEQAAVQAEGSDWFWWYGQPNHSPHEPLFDHLFCDALRAIYKAMDATVPTSLKKDILENIPD